MTEALPTANPPSLGVQSDFRTGISGRVLLAAADPEMCRLVQGLGAEGLEVEAVADGMAALAAARRQLPDLILADIMLPRLDGFRLIAALRGDTALAGLPVILLSAQAGEATRADCIEAGADDVLIMPISARDLTLQVTASFGRARDRREVRLQERNAELERQIVEREQITALRMMQNRLLELAMQNGSLSEVLEAILQAVETHAGSGLRAAILLLDVDGGHLQHGAAPNLPAAYTDAFDGIAIGPAIASCGTAAHLRKPVYAADIAADPSWADFRDLALRHGLQACWSTPILSGNGAVLGTFAMYFPAPRRPCRLITNSSNSWCARQPSSSNENIPRQPCERAATGSPRKPGRWKS